MRKPILALAVAGLVLASWVAAAETPAVSIELAHNSGNEQQVKDQLQRLLKEYDLSRWIFTRKIRIEQGTRPHSHPVLTLNTRYATNDRLMLAGFVHEQIHWFLVGKGVDASKAIADAAQRYSNAPESINKDSHAACFEAITGRKPAFDWDLQFDFVLPQKSAGAGPGC